MVEILIDSFDDPRLDPYRNLKRPAQAPRQTFVAEGERLVLRLLDSPCPTESVLCTPAARDRIGVFVPPDVPVYVTSTPVISRLIGFQFHRGVLACGRRPAEQDLESLCRAAALCPRALIV